MVRQLLHQLRRYTCVKHLRDSRVLQAIERVALVEPQLLAHRRPRLPYVSRVLQHLPRLVPRREDIVRFRRIFKPLEESPQAFRHGDHPLMVVFRHVRRYGYQPFPRVHILNLQHHYLFRTDEAPVAQLHHHVPFPHSVLLDVMSYLLLYLRRQRLTLFLVRPFRLHVLERILLRVVTLHEPEKKRPLETQVAVICRRPYVPVGGNLVHVLPCILLVEHADIAVLVTVPLKPPHESLPLRLVHPHAVFPQLFHFFVQELSHPVLQHRVAVARHAVYERVPPLAELRVYVVRDCPGIPHPFRLAFYPVAFHHHPLKSLREGIFGIIDNPCYLSHSNLGGNVVNVAALFAAFHCF